MSDLSKLKKSLDGYMREVTDTVQQMRSQGAGREVLGRVAGRWAGRVHGGLNEVFRKCGLGIYEELSGGLGEHGRQMSNPRCLMLLV